MIEAFKISLEENMCSTRKAPSFLNPDAGVV